MLLKFIMCVFPMLVKDGLAPSVWSGVSNEVKAFVYIKILEGYPFVDLCDGFWKVHLIVMRWYSDFTCHKGQSNLARLHDLRSCERSMLTAPTSGKRIKREHMSFTLSKPLTLSVPATKDGGTECKQITLLLETKQGLYAFYVLNGICICIITHHITMHHDATHYNATHWNIPKCFGRVCT
jgi:hypothetical protein